MEVVVFEKKLNNAELGKGNVHDCYIREDSDFDFKDFLATPSAKVLIPRVIIGTMRKSADPIYLASKFFKKIRLNSGNAILFPSIGVMRAHDVAEGQERHRRQLWQRRRGQVDRIGKPRHRSGPSGI